MTTYRVIGKAPARVDGAEKVTGTATYTADISLPGMLWAKALHSPYAHARILSIDTSRAKALPGVHAVITGVDTGDGLYGRAAVRDVPALARDRVRFFGERVAAVAADDKDIAQRALDLIEVEYEELPAVFEPADAMRDDAPILHPDYASYRGASPAEARNAYAESRADRGDIDAGFAAADLIVERTYYTERVHQMYLEQQAVICNVQDGVAHVWACSKVPYNLRDGLATAVGIAIDDVILHPVFIGGDFGGKGTPPDLPIAYYLSKATGRPVRVVPEYLQELMAGDPRHAVEMRLKTGVKRDGTMTAHSVYFLVNCGAYAGFKPRGAIGGANQCAGPYKIPNTRIESLHVYTNTVPGGHMRAPGEPQGMFAIESHIDEVARAIGMDPVAFRLMNLVEDGDETAFGEQLHDVRAKETLSAATQAAGYDTPKRANVGRGVAMGDRGPGGGIASANVSLRADGTAAVSTPVFDQGVGTYTTISQVVAEEFGLDIDQVEFEVWTTGAVENDSGLGGSRGTRVNTSAAYEACQQVKGELVRVAVEAMAWPEEHTVFRNGEVWRTDTEESITWPELVSRAGSPVTATANVNETGAVHLTSFTAQVAEVEVDPDTGQVRLLRFTSAHDVGRIINPVGHDGQIKGGLIMGLGYALTEELKVEDGRVTSLSFGDYKIPAIVDIPPLEVVLLESEDGVGPYQVKGIGESAIGPVAPAIANAVADAIGARINHLPITSEKVYEALKQQR